jgi:hypothetical protein
MSEEKLYAVKNAKGRYLSFSDDKLYRWREGQIAATTSPRIAHDLCTEHGGHVATLIEEPKKVVLSKEQAEIVEKANNYPYPARYILDYASYDSCVKEKSLMKAYVNGYTVAKEKKYLVYKELGGKQKHNKIAQAYLSVAVPGTMLWLLNIEVKNDPRAKFTESEIEHYGLQDCEKEEVSDDGE